jgi:hypothetical protein
MQFIPDHAIDGELFSLEFTSKGRVVGVNFATDDLLVLLTRQISGILRYSIRLITENDTHD